MLLSIICPCKPRTIEFFLKYHTFIEVKNCINHRKNPSKRKWRFFVRRKRWVPKAGVIMVAKITGVGHVMKIQLGSFIEHDSPKKKRVRLVMMGLSCFLE